MVDGRRSRRLGAGVLLLITASCGSTSLYEWGHYEDSIAAMYATGSGYDPAVEVARLVEQVEQTEHRGKLVPPGVRAHIGFLLFESGNAERGASYLLAEKNAYPESAVFVDGLLARQRGTTP